MEVLKTNQEIVHEGWLIKSPPTKLWRARWRVRWFTLRHSGELPGQYFLEYYTDKKCRKLKGKIDLDQCEQVDAGLRFENRKQKYQYMFNVKTPKRTYYLVAENEIDMNKWVDAVCQVCGLKAQDDEQMFSFPQESPPISPKSTASGPYIPISECISGPSLNDTSSISSALGQGPELYDAPRRLGPSPQRSPTNTDAESVITDDEWTAPVPGVNWDTFPSQSESRPSISASEADIGSWSVRKRFGKLRIVDSATPPAADEIPPPPRPPKPAHMSLDNPGHNYLNLDGATESSKPVTPSTPAPSIPSATPVVTDETYDFPRSHQPETIESGTLGRQSRHCYTNAAPTKGKDDRVFRYDFHDDDQPSSPMSEASTATYSNLPSPFTKSDSTIVSNSNSQPPPPTTPSASVPVVPMPPVVYRELKPGRKTSDTLSMISNELSPGIIGMGLEHSPAEHSPSGAPSINRRLKPTFTKSAHEINAPMQLASPPGRGRVRAAPSPTPPSGRHQSTSDDDNIFEDKEEIYYFQDQNTFIPASSRKFADIQYLDLDLGSSENANAQSMPAAQSPPSSTVYKTVDFVKTEAFNRTRQKVEAERKQITDGSS